jgi:ABC-type sugar transport system ATPase subunit
MASVQIRNLTIKFGDFVAVDNVSLDINNGDLVVYLGPSGCGKTTTLRCVAGLQAATAGDVLFDGKRVNDLPPTERNIAMVFQFVTLYPHLRVEDNIAFPLRARKVPKARIREKLEWIAETFMMKDIMKRYPHGLPPGAKQKVALARAVVREPNVLLLDEPLSAIDEQFREDMRWELGHLQKQLGFTTIYVTHDQREAMSLADRIALMNEGKIVQVGTPTQMYDQPRNQFAGFFIGSPGMNFIDAKVNEKGLLLGRQSIRLPFPSQLTRKLMEINCKNLRLGIRPQDVRLLSGGNSEACFQARIVDNYTVGRDRFFDFRVDEAIFKGTDCTTEPIDDSARIEFPVDKIHFFDGQSGDRLSEL